MSGTSLPYRPNVGAVLFNRDGRVFVARRADLPNAEGPAGGWQLPQGGIDPDEDPRAAVLRELAEEIGTDRAEIIGEHPDWLTYDLPPELVGVALRRALSRPDGSAGSRCASPARTATSGWTPIRIRSSMPGAGRSWPSCRRWRWLSSGRSIGCSPHHSPVSPRRNASSLRLAPLLGPPVVRFLGLGATMSHAVLLGRRRPLPAVAPLLHAMEVDDLAHAAILRSRDRTHNREGTPWAARSTSRPPTASRFPPTPPDRPAATKGLVVIQEIFGVNHHMRDMCDRFAAAGYAVCAPALFDRVETRRRARLHPGRHRQGPRLPDEAERRPGDGRTSRPRRSTSPARNSASSATASAARWPGGAPRAATGSPRRPAGTAAASPAPRTNGRTARCRCISARRTPRSR